MTTWKAYEPRTAGDVPWSRDRERRVLGGALRSWRRRGRQKRALELLTVVGSIALLSRFFPPPPIGADGTGGALGASGAERAPAVEQAPHAERAKAVSLPSDLATQVNSAPNGFAGSGGHGGGSNRIGGGAGTG